MPTDALPEKCLFPRAIVATHLPKTDAKISFDEGYPAMAVTPAGKDLFRRWSEISSALGLGPILEGGPMTRGAGDIAFVAPYVAGSSASA